MNLEDYQWEIFKVYKNALRYIGVDFSREDVQEALEYCYEGMEDAFQATISYWKHKKENIEYPTAFLIQALQEKWKAYEWDPKWLLDERFKSACQKWWDEAEFYWGCEWRNSLVADVVENSQGSDYILFMNGRTLRLSTAESWGWKKVLDYAQGEF
ncbi:MAG TPA: hypothetical protein V6D13_00210 [Halomicronema sp.]